MSLSNTVYRYAVVALFVEVNSIFLHIRQLFIVTGMSKKEPEYRFVSMVNIGTFVVFRIAVLGWMTRWLVLHRDDSNLSLPVYTLGSVGERDHLQFTFYRPKYLMLILIVIINTDLWWNWI